MVCFLKVTVLSKTLLALSILFLILVEVTNPTSVKKCKRKLLADIVFVLDSSASIHRHQFRQQLQFVEDVVNKFPISKKEIRVGLLTFSYFVYPAFNLSSFNDKTSLRKGIRTAKYAGQGTFTAQAIAYARETMFADTNGARENVPKIMIIVTDGISENKTITAFEARLSKLRGIKMFVVGVGDAVDRTELQAIASAPPNKYVLNVNGYDRLGTVIDQLSRKACIESKLSFTGSLNDNNVSAVGKGKPSYFGKGRKSMKRRHLTFVYNELQFQGDIGDGIRKSIGLMVKRFNVSKIKMFFSLFSRVDTSSPQRRTHFLNTLFLKKQKSENLRRLLKSVYKTIQKRRSKEIIILFISGKQLQNKQVLRELKRLGQMSDLNIVKMSQKYRFNQMDLCHIGQKCVYTVTKAKSLNNILALIKQKICPHQHC